MKYKIINLITKEELLCSKVLIDGFDYYVNDEEINTPCYVITDSFKDKLIKVDKKNEEDWHKANCRKIIATTNLYINVPQVISAAVLSKEAYQKFSKVDSVDAINFRLGFIEGYNTFSKEYSFNYSDIIEFKEWLRKEATEYNAELYANLSDKDMIILWRKQQIKTVYVK